MDRLQEILDKATKEGKYVPELQLFVKKDGGGTEPTGPHKVKLINSAVVKGIDFKTKKEILEIKLSVEEDGTLKTYNFPMWIGEKIHYLIERLAPIKEGSEVTLEGKKSAKSSYIEVDRGGAEPKKEIPIIEE